MTLKHLYETMDLVPGIVVSDKGDLHPTHRHFYIDIYDQLFTPRENEPIRIMELGIFEGASVMLWSKFFTNGIVTGLDIAEPARKDYLVTLPNLQMIFGNAYHPQVISALLDKLPKQDIFIDDGMHDADSQITAVQNYHALVKPGGYYIVEDILPSTLSPLLSVIDTIPRNYKMTVHNYNKRIGSMGDDILLVIQFEN